MPTKRRPATDTPAAKPATNGPKGDAAFGMTLQECADAMGVTRERIRQIEISAIKKAKQILSSRYGIHSDNANRVLFDILNDRS